MIKCYILDDEQHAVDALVAMLKKKFSDQVSVVGSHTVAQKAIDEIEMLDPDVLFLDVEMPSMSGMDVLKHFPQRRFHVIFTTAHEKYALPAIKAAATDYLLKPLSPQDVYDALQKCAPRKEAVQETTSPAGTKITLTTANEMLVIHTSDIIRIESDNNYSMFYFTNRPKLLISKTLKEFEVNLATHHFFRIHQSHLINLDHVTSVHTTEGGYVELTQGHKVEISRRRKAEFFALLKNR
jgi:two-component system LytT family response regulator